MSKDYGSSQQTQNPREEIKGEIHTFSIPITQVGK
jgi:hypothetical protein